MHPLNGIVCILIFLCHSSQTSATSASSSSSMMLHGTAALRSSHSVPFANSSTSSIHRIPQRPGPSPISSISAGFSLPNPVSQSASSSPSISSANTTSSSSYSTITSAPSSSNLPNNKDDVIDVGEITPTVISTATFGAGTATALSSVRSPTAENLHLRGHDTNGRPVDYTGPVIVGKGGLILFNETDHTDGAGGGGAGGFGGFGLPISPPALGLSCDLVLIDFCPKADGGDPGTDEKDEEQSSSAENKSTSTSSSSPSTTSSQSSPSASSSSSSSSISSSSSTSSSSTSSVSSSPSPSANASTCAYCPGCGPSEYILDWPALGDDDDDDESASDDGNSTVPNQRRSRLRKRAVGTVKSAIGNCNVNPYTLKPSYITAQEVESLSPLAARFIRTNNFWAVPLKKGPGGCAPKLGWKRYGSKEIASGSTYQHPDNGQPYAFGNPTSSAPLNVVNMDHVYEFSILSDFLSSQITNTYNCQSFKNLWDIYRADGAKDVPNILDIFNPFTGTLLNQIFAQLPSNLNPDFLGMDRGLNRLKGALWNDRLAFLSTALPNGNPLVKLKNVGLVTNITQDEYIRIAFDNTNKRLYSAFLGIDEYITNANNCRGKHIYLDPPRNNPKKKTKQQANWAANYKAYLLDKVSAQNALISSTASVWSVAAAATDPAGLANVLSIYPIASMTLPSPVGWPTNRPVRIVKRQDSGDNGDDDGGDDGSGAACALIGDDTGSSSSSSSAALATPSPIPSTTSVFTIPPFTPTSLLQSSAPSSSSSSSAAKSPTPAPVACPKSAPTPKTITRLQVYSNEAAGCEAISPNACQMAAQKFANCGSISAYAADTTYTYLPSSDNAVGCAMSVYCQSWTGLSFTGSALGTAFNDTFKTVLPPMNYCPNQLLKNPQVSAPSDTVLAGDCGIGFDECRGASCVDVVPGA